MPASGQPLNAMDTSNVDKLGRMVDLLNDVNGAQGVYKVVKLMNQLMSLDKMTGIMAGIKLDGSAYLAAY